MQLLTVEQILASVITALQVTANDQPKDVFHSVISPKWSNADIASWLVEKRAALHSHILLDDGQLLRVSQLEQHEPKMTHVVGLLLASPLPAKGVYIDLLWLKPDSRGQGAGTRALTQFLDHVKAVSKEANMIVGLDCESHLVSYYCRFGAVATGEKTQDGFEIMEIRLHCAL